MSVSHAIVRELPFEYYCNSAGLNASLAKLLFKSPRHFEVALRKRKPDEDESLAKRVGNYVHAWTLTGITPQYVIRPAGRPISEGVEDLDDLWHGNKRWVKDWKRSQTPGVEIMSQEQADREVALCNSLAEDEIARAAFKACPERELSFFVTYRGIPIKARIDACNLSPGRILDLKTCRDGSPRGFGKAIVDFDYLLSAAWYRTVLKLATAADDYPVYAWLAAEGGEGGKPYLYQATDEQLAIGHERMELALDIFLRCRETQSWPGYFEEPVGTAILPYYWLRDHENQRLRLTAPAQLQLES